MASATTINTNTVPYADKHSPAAVASRRKASRAFYERNREKEIARCAEYNRANKARVNANSVERRSKKTPPEHVLWSNARNRAKARGIEFNIEKSDVLMPAVCPVLGIPLVVGTGHARDNSPSVDRIDPSNGYVKGNVRVISHKANTIKSNATVEDLRAVLAYMEGA